MSAKIEQKKFKGAYLIIGAMLLIIAAGVAFLWINSLNGQTLQLTANSETSDKYLGEDWTLTSVNDEPVTLSDYHGRPVILVFWATWCPYCKKLLPGIQRLHEKYATKGLKIIAVNIKEDWKPKVYWRNHEYQFDAVLQGDEVAKIYAVSGTPTVVFIEPSGKVLAVNSFSDPENPLLEKFAEFYTKAQPE